jgi:hypothetical protein
MGERVAVADAHEQHGDPHSADRWDRTRRVRGRMEGGTCGGQRVGAVIEIQVVVAVAAGELG